MLYYGYNHEQPGGYFHYGVPMDNVYAAMAGEVWDLTVERILQRNSFLPLYRIAWKVFQAFQMNTLWTVTREECKIAVDVIKEIRNMQTENEFVKRNNACRACLCKMMLDMYWQEGRIYG